MEKSPVNQTTWGIIRDLQSASPSVRAVVELPTVIHPSDEKTQTRVPKSATSPPLSIFAQPRSPNIVYRVQRYAFTFFGQTLFIVSACFRAHHPVQYTTARKQDDSVVKLSSYDFILLSSH